MHNISGPLTFFFFFVAFLFWVTKVSLAKERDQIENERSKFVRSFNANYDSNTTTQQQITEANLKVQEYNDRITVLNGQVDGLYNGTTLLALLGGCGLAHLGYEASKKIKTIQTAMNIVPREKSN